MSARPELQARPFVVNCLAAVILRAKNIVTAGKERTTVRYEIRDPLGGYLLDVARRIFNNQLAGTQTMLRALRQEARRPARR